MKGMDQSTRPRCTCALLLRTGGSPAHDISARSLVGALDDQPAPQTGSLNCADRAEAIRKTHLKTE